MPQRILGFVLGLCVSAVMLLIGTLLLQTSSSGSGFFTYAIVAGAGALAIYLVLMAVCYLLAWIISTFPAATTSVSFIVFVLILIGIVLWEKASGPLPGLATFLVLLVVVFIIPLVVYAYFSIPKGILTLIGYIVADTTAFAWPAGELFFRGGNVGFNAAYAVFFGALCYATLLTEVLGPAGLPAAVVLALLFLFVPFAGLVASTDISMKGILGWTVFLAPTSWFVNGLGAVFFLIGVSLHWLAVLAPGTGPLFFLNSVAIHPAFGSIVTVGGLPGNLNLAGGGAYNLGTFVLAFGPATNAGTVLHEAGHGLNLSVFGGHFHFVGWFEEILGFVGLVSGGGAGAYAERLADSNRTAGPVASMWN